MSDPASRLRKSTIRIAAPPMVGNESLNQRKISSLNVSAGVPGVSTIFTLKKKVSELRRRRKVTVPAMEPTYRTEPKLGEVYSEARSKAVIEACHNFFLKSREYEATRCALLCKLVSDDIRRQLMAEDTCPRYKVVVYTSIWPNSFDHSISISSRSLINPKTDNFVSSDFENNCLRATSIVFWIYCE